MCDALVHRGPDDAGEWIDAEAGVALGFRRLAILDLSPAGHQPMASALGRYVATLQRRDLQLRRAAARAAHGPSARPFGHRGDAGAFDAWGVEAALQKFIGMFAHRAVGSRDAPSDARPRSHGREAALLRIRRTTFLFALGAEGAAAASRFDGQIDRGALRSTCATCYVPAPWSIYEGICKLMPGTMLTVRSGRRGPSRRQRTGRCARRPRDGAADRFRGSEEEASHELERCSAMRCGCAWSPTCRSACSCPAASTPRSSRR